MDIGTTETVFANALGGDDVITVGPGLAALTAVRVDAGAGNDTITSTASSTLTLDGSTELDTLNFNGEGQAVQSLGGSIVVGGTTRVSHQNVETVNVANAAGAPPVITITSPTADPTFTSDASSITLAGTAADDTGIASVTWVNNRGGSGAASGTTSWTASGIPLAGGVNIIAVTATDLTGNSTTDTLTVTVTQLTYLLAEGSTGAFFDLDVLDRQPERAGGADRRDLPQGGRHHGHAEPERRGDVAADAARRPDRRARGNRGVDGRDVDGRPAARRRAVDVLGQQLLRIARRHRRRRAAHPAGTSPRARRASSRRSCCSRTRARSRRR